MNALRHVVDVLKDLVIGDDWRMTAGVVTLLAVVAELQRWGRADAVTWVLLPLGTAALLLFGVGRASGPRSRRPGGRP